MRPVQSTIGLFKSHVLVGKLVEEFMAPCTLTHSVRTEAIKPGLQSGVVVVTQNNCERAALSSGC